MDDKSPLWCVNDDPHPEHTERNEFGSTNYCSGRPQVVPMREGYDAFKEGWIEAAAELERRCIKVWLPSGEYGWAVPQGEIVQLRSMVTTTKEQG